MPQILIEQMALALPTEASGRPGIPVPPPQRDLRRRSRFAARRTAGTSNRSRRPTGDLRPPSFGEKSRKGFPLPGFRRWRRKESESFFPAACTAGKILLTERRVGAAWAGPAPKRSAIATGGTPGLARGNGSAISPKHLTERSVGGPAFAGPPAPERSGWPSSQRPSGAETGPSRPNVPRYIWAKSSFSQRKACRRRAVPPSGA